ncbi:hypothetical protein QOT17_016233 [Balamuthia mandrillaris]
MTLSLVSVFSLLVCCLLLPSRSLALVEVEGKDYIARWPANEPSTQLYAKNQQGDRRTEDFFTWDVLAVQERSGCSCCKASFVGQSVLNCSTPEVVTGSSVNLKNVSWEVEELVPRQKVRWSTRDWAGDALLEITFEDVPQNTTSLSISNGKTNRTLLLTADSLRYSVHISNYKPTTFNITEEPERYFALFLYNRYYLNRPVLPGPLFGMFSPNGAPGEYQIGLKMQSRDQPILHLEFVQTTFLLSDPPSASRELEEEDEWGFEIVDPIPGEDVFVNGELVGKDIVVMHAGGETIFYDPDFSIFFSDDTDGEEEDEDDDSEALIAGLSVMAVVLFVGVLAIAGGIFWWMQKTRRIAQSNVVNFSDT